MRKKLTVLFALLVLAFTLPVLAEEMTVDELIAKNIEARGGAEAWEKVESAKIVATLAPGNGMELPITLFFMRPGMVRVEMEMQGQKIIQAYDGETGWQIMPLMGKTEPQKMTDDEVKQIQRQADFEGPLVNYEKKGHQVELLGKEEVEGTEAYKLKVTLESGDVAYVYLDADAYLEFKQEAVLTAPTGQQVKTEITTGDYKQVGDILLAHSMEMQPEGAPQGMNITFQSVELEPEGVDADFFAMPEAAPAAAPTDQ